MLIFSLLLNMQSHPTWVRGLKHKMKTKKTQNYVAPYVGAWIETSLLVKQIFLRRSRTLRGCVD